jgi:hypothetical protein
MQDSTEKNQPRTITDKDIVGLKYFDQLGQVLQQLHHVGCERDKAGNRLLHMDQYCMLMLLYMFNPVVKSLRGLQQASELKRVKEKLGCERSSLGSLSEFVSVFDPERLKPIIESLGEKTDSCCRCIRTSKWIAPFPQKWR